MTKFMGTNFTNATEMTSTENDAANIPLEISYIITIIINSITCPFTVLLNVLVIMAVKRRPRLQTNSNILLACLAATDALTGFIVQPSFILWKIFQLLGAGNSEGLSDLHNVSLCTVLISSLLHLMLVTFERPLAIKFTMRYFNVITEKNIKIAVTVFWIIAISTVAIWLLKISFFSLVFRFFLILILVSCILFVASAYVILYHETRRQRKKIKTQQLPQEEVERFTKENKALKTTVYVVGAVLLCLLPASVFLILLAAGLSWSLLLVWLPWARTFGMLNSFLNPLIYCWRQHEMRKFIFRIRTQVVQVHASC